MTEHSASHDQPSMDDILASIRRIMDDGDASPAPVSAVSTAPAARAAAAPVRHEPDPDEETIFPERGGLLWRRVAGRSLEDAEQQAADEETLDLTDIIDGEEPDEYELNELLDETAGIESDESALSAVADSVGTDADDGADEDLAESLAHAERLARETPASPPPLPTDAGPAALGMPMMDRVIGRVESPADDEDDDEILDLTRPVSDDASLDDIALAMVGDEPGEATIADEGIDLHASVTPYRDEDTGSDAEIGVETEDGYETSLRPNSGYETPQPDDAHERALDARFYADASSYDDDAPDVDGNYASAFAQETGHQPKEPDGPAEDELDTVGGLVRDALRGRNPAIVGDSPTALVSRDAEESSSRALATLARIGGHTPRRVYGELRITDEEDAPTIDAVVRDELRPMLREWLSDNLPTVVENMVKQEVDRISARSRRFVRSDDD